MKILILGSGGREHAFAWKIAQSKEAEKIFIAPGNAGTQEIGENVPLALSNFEQIASFIKEKNIELLVVGPEAPLVDGIWDYFQNKDGFKSLKIIGPSKEAAQLEGSKEYAKEFMLKNRIPTARFQSFTASTINKGVKFLESLKAPYVLKADGLAGGKGVVILSDLAKAKDELKSMLIDGKFGKASKSVVIEEYLDGIEMSVFVLTDGVDYLVLPEAKDYKRIGEGDTGLNTGGMGAISPVPFANEQLRKKIEDKIIQPSIQGLKKQNLNYKGFLFIGLMIVDEEPFVIEYNVRMGDPETEVVLPRIDSDLLQHLIDCADGKLGDHKISFSKQAATTIMLVAGGYPEKYDKGMVMTGWDELGDCIPFHAGTKVAKNQILTNGGRVIAISALGQNFKDALAKSYRNADRIRFEGKFFRKDIGFDLMGFD